MQEIIVNRPSAHRRPTFDRWESASILTGKYRTKLKVASNGVHLVYPPLDDNEIRLVHINRGRGSEPIICDMYCSENPIFGLRGTNEDWEASPRYYAVSYTWGDAGDATKTREITVSGEGVQVTENLYDFLWKTREILSTPKGEREDALPRVTGGMTKDSIDRALFWIDALCINQNDQTEKEKQIPRMGSIYNLAHEVIVWLGLTKDPVVDKQIGDVFRFGKGLMYIAREWFQDSEATEAVTMLLRHPLFVNLAEYLHKMGNLSWSGLIDVATSRWFSRMWVAQELAMADGGAWVYAGSHNMSFNHLMVYLSAILGCLENEPEARYLVLLQSRFFGNFQDLSMLRQCNREFAQRRNSLSGREAQIQKAKFLAASVAFSRKLECSQAHDKVYALLGMIGAKELPEALRPDYSKPLEQVYRDYAVYIAGITGDLSILHTFRGELDGGPTWVPDFRWSLGHYYEDRNDGTVTFVDGGLTMVVQGWRVGVVSETYYDGAPDPVPRTISPVNTPFPSLFPKFELFLGRAAVATRQSKDDLRDGWLRYASSINILARNQPFDANQMRQLRKSFAALSKAHDERHRDVEVSAIATRLSWGHFLTMDGIMGYYERSDRQVRPGDVVCLVQGSIPPIILRPAGRLGHYTLVSICMMYCEPPCVLGDMTTYKPQGKCEEFYVV